MRLVGGPLRPGGTGPVEPGSQVSPVTTVTGQLPRSPFPTSRRRTPGQIEVSPSCPLPPTCERPPWTPGPESITGGEMETNGEDRGQGRSGESGLEESGVPSGVLRKTGKPVLSHSRLV